SDADDRQTAAFHCGNTHLSSHLFGHFNEDASLLAVGCADNDRYADVARLPNAERDRDLSEQGRVESSRQAFAPARAENIMPLRTIGANEVAHILDDTEDRYLDLLKHVKRLSDIGHCDFLRRSHQYRALHRYQLSQAQLRISGARRHIYYQII